MTVTAGELCSRCGHPFDPHILWASNTGDPLDGGHMTCPVEGCECISTWDTSIGQSPPET